MVQLCYRRPTHYVGPYYFKDLMPTVNSKTKHHTVNVQTFRGGYPRHVISKWQSNFEVKRLKVTGAEM